MSKPIKELSAKVTFSFDFTAGYQEYLNDNPDDAMSPAAYVQWMLEDQDFNPCEFATDITFQK